MPRVTIDAKDFFRGMSTTDELADGGFSPRSKGINLFAKPGLVLPGQAPVDVAASPDISNGIFGWDAVSSAGFFGRAIGSNSSKDGKFYLIDATGAIGATTTDTSKDYTPNISDLAIFNYAVGTGGQAFVTSETDVFKAADDFSAGDPTWWTVTLGKTAMNAFSPHHIIEYGGILYWSDGKYIHSWDGSTGTYNALDLPTGYIIDDLRVHNNLIYIAASPSTRFNMNVVSRSRIFTWDGFSDSFIDEFPIQERILTLIPFGGTLFLTTSKYFGYFTGATISPLYPLTSNVNKYQVAVTNDRLYMLQGQDVICYGNPIFSRPKFLSFPLQHPQSLISLGCIQTGSLVYSYAGKMGAWSDVNGFDQTGNTFYVNRLPLGGNARIKGMIVECEALASGTVETIAYIDDSQTSMSVGTLSFASFAATTRRVFELWTGRVKRPTLTCQPTVTFTTGPNKGIRRIHIEYEASELKANS